MISSTNLISSYFIRDTGRASSQPSGNLSNSFPDGIPVGNLIPLMRPEFPMEAFAKRTCAGVPPLLSGLAGRRPAGFADFRLSHGVYSDLLRADSGRHPASASARLRLMAVHNSCRWQAF